MNSRKTKAVLLVGLPVLGVILTATGYFMRVWYWASIDFNLFSYHPYLPFISWSTWTIYVTTIWLTPQKEHWYIKTVAIMWAVMNVVFTAGILQTHWGIAVI